MNKFIKLKRCPEGSPVYINTERISAVYASDYGNTVIILDNSDSALLVKESPKEIMDKT